MSAACRWRRLLTSLALLGMGGGALAAEAPAQDAPAAVATRLFDAFNRHDLAALAALYADDAEIVSPDHPAALHGPGAVGAIYAPLFARFPDLHDRVVTITADDARVAVEFVSTGCAAPATDCFALPIASVLTVRAGRIVRDISYFDVVD